MQKIMAKNTGNNRIAVKWIRDKAKSAYEKADTCYVCGTSEDLELHHTHSITILLENWAKKQGYDISTDAEVLAVREEFIEAHHREIYEEVYTLCNKHHVKLHSVYGKKPLISTADKQAAWIERQKDKCSGVQPEDSDKPKVLGSFFSKFT